MTASSSSTDLNIVFAGTPEFAAIALSTLIKTKHNIVAVYTQPDKPSGRGLKVMISPVKTVALTHQLPIFQPKTLNDNYEIECLRDCNPDVMVVAAYGLLLPRDILQLPRLGCINIHPSLLPRWRGAAPIQRAIYAGDSVTGATIMQMDQGLDTGPILLKREYIIEPDETASTLTHKLAMLGTDVLIEALDLLAQHKITPTPQSNEKATYAQKITKEEALIDWQQDAATIEREVRAFNPWPVAYTSWQGQRLRIWQARALAEDHQVTPRTIVRASADGIDVATGKGILRLLQLQIPGGKVLAVRDFYNARSEALVVGEHLI